MKSDNICFIGMGSNLNNPKQQLLDATKNLGRLNTVNIISGSRIYESLPCGPQDQPNYYNAVIHITTVLSPLLLLKHLLNIENQHKRKRIIHWGPRTLDLDLLLYNNLQLKTECLTIPHPYMHKRNFVIYPLMDIAPNIRFPCGMNIKTIYDQLDKKNIWATNQWILQK